MNKWIYLAIAIVANGLFGIFWKRSMSVTTGPFLFTVVGFCAGLSCLTAFLVSHQPISRSPSPELWVVYVAAVCCTVFYLVNSRVFAHFPVSIAYPILSAGTIVLILIYDTALEHETLTLRKAIGIVLAIAAIWCIKSGAPKS